MSSRRPFQVAALHLASSSLAPPVQALTRGKGLFSKGRNHGASSPRRLSLSSPNSSVYDPSTAWHSCARGADAAGSDSNNNDNNGWLLCQWGYLLCPFDDAPSYSPEEMAEVYEEALGDWFFPCTPCPTAPGGCHEVFQNAVALLNATDDYDDDGATDDDDHDDDGATDDDDYDYDGMAIHEYNLETCLAVCEAGEEGEPCSAEYPCAKGSYYCDHREQDDVEGGDDAATAGAGSCRACPADPSDCFLDEGPLAPSSDAGRRSCAECVVGECEEYGSSSMVVDGEEEEIPAFFMNLAVRERHQVAVGPLIDCTALLLGEGCEGAEGRVCLVEEHTKEALYWELSRAAEASGCIAIAMFASWMDEGPGGFHSYDDLAIPFVSIPSTDGERLRDAKLGSDARIEVNLGGMWCGTEYWWGYNHCSNSVPCPGDGEYCDYSLKVVDGEYAVGRCNPCPMKENGDPDPFYCYFDPSSGGYVRDTPFIQSCSAECEAQLTFHDCKFCPENIKALEFGIDDESEQCQFCPEQDVQHPDREIPVFDGGNVMCWQMQSFFQRNKVDKDSKNCRIFQSLNHICGCQGTGYAGASTPAKQKALVWVPRVIAIMSLLGSLFIIFHASRTPQRRKKFTNQLLITLSVFDAMGSLAYAFTTAPTPSSDYIYGAVGNKNTCIAQGFFIQIGTIACFCNASLAIAYLCVIKHGWSEDRLQKKRLLFFSCPIVVGLAFAFGGIPFYDNMILWCNNSAKWWPEVPVILSIAVSTGAMGDLCLAVYRIEKASARYASNSSGYSKSVFDQAIWFVAAFYLTWVPYLALQYVWSSGEGFSDYAFTLFAGMTVPMQGLFNFFIYIRPRYLVTGATGVNRTSTGGRSSIMQNVASLLWRQHSTVPGGQETSNRPSAVSDAKQTVDKAVELSSQPGLKTDADDTNAKMVTLGSKQSNS